MPGDVGAVATLLTTILQWFTEPGGFAKVTREAKLAKLMEGLKVALDEKDYKSADLIFAALRELSAQSGP